MPDADSACCGLSAGKWCGKIRNKISRLSSQSYAEMNLSWPLVMYQFINGYKGNLIYQFSRNARNCSLEPASGEVEQKRTKNCCFSFSLGTFKFFIYMLTCGLYCLLLFPDTSSAHGMTRRLKTGLPFATSRMGFGPKSFQTVSSGSRDVFKCDQLWNPLRPRALISGYVKRRSLAGIRIISVFLTRYFSF